jgi:hypothetical protein
MNTPTTRADLFREREIQQTGYTSEIKFTDIDDLNKPMIMPDWRKYIPSWQRYPCQCTCRHELRCCLRVYYKLKQDLSDGLYHNLTTQQACWEKWNSCMCCYRHIQKAQVIDGVRYNIPVVWKAIDIDNYSDNDSRSDLEDFSPNYKRSRTWKMSSDIEEDQVKLTVKELPIHHLMNPTMFNYIGQVHKPTTALLDWAHNYRLIHPDGSHVPDEIDVWDSDEDSDFSFDSESYAEVLRGR